MTDRHDSVQALSPAQAFLRSQLPVSPLTRSRRRPVDTGLLRIVREALRPILRAARKRTRRTPKR